MDGGARHPKRAKDGSEMTIEELLTNAQQCLVKMHQEDGDNLLAINTWANATRAYTQTAQVMMSQEQRLSWIAEQGTND